MINLSYQYKLKLTRWQMLEIDKILSVCKSVYNYALKERKDWLNSRKSPITACSLFQEYIVPVDAPYPNYNIQAKNLTQARKTNEFLDSVHSQVLQQTLMTLDKAFVDMKSKGFGFPRYKNKMRSFLFPQLSVNCLGSGVVKLPSLGEVRIRQSREYPTGFVAKQARIVKKASSYYVIITFQSSEECPEHPVGEKSLGLDAGIELFVATSEGELIKSPKFLQKALRKLKLLQRRFKAQKKRLKELVKTSTEDS